MMTAHFVIVGGGQAAAQAVQTLRQQGFGGEITLVGDERYAPYQRPPLSKKYLAGTLPKERLLLRPEGFYADRNVQLALRCRAEELDLSTRSVRLADGRVLRYDRLLLATGSQPRRLALPGATLPAIHYVRTIDDVDAILAALTAPARVVLVGAGYIGLEIAAVLVRGGHDVTVLEAQARVMARVVCPEVSEFYEREHRGAGVQIHLGAQVTGFRGRERVEAVEAAGAEAFGCDLAIVGIGVAPNVELAERAGLPCDDGIIVDEYARTQDPHVFAAGDCTNHPQPLFGRRARLESVPHAIHQAKVAAQSMIGAPSAYSEVPWFWSDQYDLKLQIAGLTGGYDRIVLRGDRAAKSFAAYYLADGKIVAVDAVNSPRDFLNGKRLVGARFAISAEALADPRIDVTTLGA